MTIYYAHDAQGGFTAGDAETGLTCYAYPTSTHARTARRRPEATAAEMLKAESVALRMVSQMVDIGRLVAEHDRRNWDRLAQLCL